MVENIKLRAALVTTQGMNSISVIQPQQYEGDAPTNNLNPNPESILLINQCQNQYNNESGEVLNKIENMMTELTRMMDNLENMQNTETKNFTYHLSNTTNNNNNVTY